MKSRKISDAGFNRIAQGLGMGKKAQGWESMDDFCRQYAETALWSSVDDNGEPMDDTYEVEDLASETVEKMMEDCNSFQSVNEELLERAYEATGNDSELAGHDFWLTRKGAGAGFWDGDWNTEEEDFGKLLTEASKRFGEVGLYVGDDGKIYQ